MPANQPTQFAERGAPARAQAGDLRLDLGDEGFVAEPVEARAVARDVLLDLLEQGHALGQRRQARVGRLADRALRRDAAGDQDRIERIGLGALVQELRISAHLSRLQNGDMEACVAHGLDEEPGAFLQIL